MMLFVACVSTSSIARLLDSITMLVTMLFEVKLKTHAVKKIRDVQTRFNNYVKKY